jgi:hypothetical protein
MPCAPTMISDSTIHVSRSERYNGHMQRSLILQYVPNADPRFVSVLEQAEEPNPAVRERVLQRLPDLHRAFLQKLIAEKKQDLSLWKQAVDQEMAVIAACDVW